jgi:hypothetical protein
VRKPSPSTPLVNRGAEALEAVLSGDETHAEEQVQLLTRSELLQLATAADRLAALARAAVHATWPGYQERPSPSDGAP